MIRAAVLLLMLTSSALGATTVTLRASAPLTSVPVRLSDIAEVDGDPVGDPVVLEAMPSDGVIRLDEVRTALDAAGVNWGRVALRGGECRVRRAPLRIVAHNENPVASEREFDVVDMSGPETVRTRIVRLLSDLYAAEHGDLRVRFDASDAEYIDSVALGARYETTIESSGRSGRAPVRVVVFEGDRVASTRTVRADVQVRRKVLVLTSTVDRGQRIDSSVFKASRRWVSPTGSSFVDDAGAVIGQLARTRLGSGTALREAHLDRPILIKRNDLATVLCLSGSVTLRVQARAQEDGREGDIIEFRKGRRDEAFTARVSGAGFAVSASKTEADE